MNEIKKIIEELQGREDELTAKIKNYKPGDGIAWLQLWEGSLKSVVDIRRKLEKALAAEDHPSREELQFRQEHEERNRRKASG